MKAVSAVKEAVSAVWEAVVASPARSARQSIGKIMGSPMNSADIQNTSESADDVGKVVEPMEVENVVELDANAEPTVKTKPESEQEIQSGIRLGDQSAVDRRYDL